LDEVCGKKKVGGKEINHPSKVNLLVFCHWR